MFRIIALLFTASILMASAKNPADAAGNVALWYDAFHKNDPSLFDRILDERWMDIPPAPGQQSGPTGAKQLLVELRTAFPDLAIEIKDVVVQGNRTAVRSEISGTHRGAFLGRAATGRKLRIQAIDIHEFEGGKIVRTWHTEDWMTGLRQIGILE
jgi:predicted ester cyclase